MSSQGAPGANGVSPSSESLPTDTTATPPTSVTDVQSSKQPERETEDGTASVKPSSKMERPQPKPTTTEQNIQEAGQGVKLTGAQLKKQKAAEKAARRAEKVALKGQQAQEEQAQGSSSRPSQQQQRRPSQAGKDNDKLQTIPTSKHQRKPSTQPLEPGAVRIPFRPGGTAQQPAASPGPQPTLQKVEKKVPLVSHLYTSARPASLSTASREIHPAVLTLALHLRSLTLAGSTARTLALLLTLKRVVKAYTTPPSTALSRHLTTHLSHQISFLSSARPLGIPQGSAIRWLKKLIAALDPDLDDNDAKKVICDEIDKFVREKLMLASEVIAEEACKRIESTGETILVYGKSSVVEKTLLRAAREEKKSFKVVIVDSRPLFEGRNLARGLLRAGMREGAEFANCDVVYSLVSGLADVFEQHSVTKCLLGASGMLGNGSLYSRSGTAMVAMMAKQYNVPVIVLGESLKFTGKMAVDSLSLNEVGDADALVEKDQSCTITVEAPPKQDEAKKGGGGKKKADEDTKEQDEDARKKGPLEGWQDQQGLFLLNLMYDVTPKEFLDMVICELGTLPPSAVPVVKGDSGDE